MREDVKARWISALRSGEYPQAKDALKTPSGYCCLGVLCELAVADGVIEPYDAYHDGYPWIDEDGSTNYAEAILPPPVMKWAELEDANPFVRYVQDSGAEMISAPISEPNDNGAGFNFIARLIDEQL